MRYYMKHDQLQQLPQVLRDFITYTQVIQGKSEHTVDEYFGDLRTFLRYIKRAKGWVSSDTPDDQISLDDVDLDFIEQISLSDIVEFLNYCQNDRGNNAATRARKTSSLRAFFHYLVNKTGQLQVNTVQELDTPKIKKSLPKYMTLEESISFLESIEGPYRERDYCIMTLFLNCGLRLSELCGLNLSDVRNDSTLRVLGKGNKERIVYLNDACSHAIANYLRVRPTDGLVDKNALFISKQKKRISPKTVQHLVKQYLEKSGLDGRGLSTHKLRHTAATLMYQYGNVDIRVLQDLLGHANLGTTEIYTHLSDEQLKHAADASPLAHINSQEKTGQ